MPAAPSPTSDLEPESGAGRDEAASDVRVVAVPAWIVAVAYPLTAFLAVALLFVHAFKWDAVRVDSITLALLGVLALLPLVGQIRRVRYGDLEAEIGEREVRGLRRDSADLPAAPKRPLEEGELTARDLVRRDPQLALAKLRIALEEKLRRLAEQHLPEPRRGYTPLPQVVRELREARILGPEIEAPLRDVLSIANRAIHGEFVRASYAEEVVSVGERLDAALAALLRQ